MSRPTPVPVSIIDELWYQKLNTNFQQILNAPFPIFQLTEEVAPPSSGGIPLGTRVQLNTFNGVVESPSGVFTNTSGNGYSNAIVSDVSTFGSGACNSTLPQETGYRIGISMGSPPTVPITYYQPTYRMESSADTWYAMIGTGVSSSGPLPANAICSVHYHDSVVDYYIDGLIVHTRTSVTSGQDCFFAASIYYGGGVLEGVEFSRTLSEVEPGELTFEDRADLYSNCIGVYNGILYVSNGTSWNRAPQALLSVLADLVPGVATIQDIQDAFNTLLADMRTKNWLT